MNVLQLDGNRSVMRRYSRLPFDALLREHGIESRRFVWEQYARDGLGFTSDNIDSINAMYRRVEQRLRFRSVLTPSHDELFSSKDFIEADLIHLHAADDGCLSLFDIKHICQSKPTVWTLHDPWIMSGSGFGAHPDVEIPISVLKDHPTPMFNLKSEALKCAPAAVLVASRWMEDLVRASPLFKNAPVHRVPFGLDLAAFGAVSQVGARTRLGIPADATVIGFCARPGPCEGFGYIEAALRRLRDDREIWLLSTGRPELSSELRERYGVLELSLDDDDEAALHDFYAALDLVLMPSIVEPFGLIAVEAMASRRPVVVFDGTALRDVTLAPDIGVLVAARDVDGLTSATQDLIDRPEERSERGTLGRDLAEARYDARTEARVLAGLYREALKTVPRDLDRVPYPDRV